jgi:hypothetical protein
MVALVGSVCADDTVSSVDLPSHSAEAQEIAHEEEHLGLSDDFVPFEELGRDFTPRPRPVTEVIEDSLFPQNRERNAILERRESGDVAALSEELPERRNLFGGNPFLGSGQIYEGFEIPTGAIWQPVFIAYGTMRSAIQTFDNGGAEFTEWSNRLDLFGNLYLTPTERLLIQFRPFDDEGEFTGYTFDGPDEGSFEEFNGNIRSLFFEGDFGELFPNLDPTDRGNLDYGFSFGRQPLDIQDGIMVNDSIDSIGVSRASLFMFGASASRITGYFGVNELHRGNNRRDNDALFYGLSMASDYDKSTWEFDVAYVDGSDESGGDGLYGGVGQTRRFGHWNSTLRVNGSYALDDETDAVNTGGLITSQLSRTATYNNDIFYFNTFYGIDDYTSAARDPGTGGPLGSVGILYAAPGIGEYQAPLGNGVGENLGFAVGYQHFIDDENRSQLIGELAGRYATDNGDQSSLGLGGRFQQAFGLHHILVIDTFVAGYDDPALDDFGYGVRCEWQIKF